LYSAFDGESFEHGGQTMQQLAAILLSPHLRYFSPTYWICVLLRFPRSLSLLLSFVRFGEAGDTLRQQSIGSLQQAYKLVRRARNTIPAYQRHLAINPDIVNQWGSVPLLDKANYIQRNNLADLLGQDYEQTYAIFRSSGSSGKATYWPQLKSSDNLSARALQAYLEACFSVHKKRTLVVVGLSLGSWIGGEHLAAQLKQAALMVPYPLTIFAPGNHYDEILEIVGKAEQFFDQIILAVCPSAIGHMLLLAQERSISLPLNKMKYLVLGEAFPESFRQGLQQRSGLLASEPIMFSMYGSADTGALGVESLYSVALRQLLLESPALREKFGIIGVVPHLFHACAPDAYLETVNEELIVTRWQGIPLLRYNLHDRVELYSWKITRQTVLALDSSSANETGLQELIASASPHFPPLLAVYGRADRCLILCGTNLTEGMLNATVKCLPLQTLLSGVYQARILYEQGRQYLALDIELQKGATISPAIDAHIYSTLVDELGKAQPEFADDWQHIYSNWDKDVQSRVLRIQYHKWPKLSEALSGNIKQAGIAT